MSRVATLCLTCDVLTAPIYGAIHDLSVLGSAFSAYGEPLARFIGLAERLGARTTLFITGLDMLQPDYRERAAEALQARHEVASLGFEYDLRLGHRSKDRIRSDLRTSIDAIREAVGRVPRGLRAPGYDSTSRLLDEAERLGFYWDSSVHPSPVLLGARAAALFSHHVRNRSPAAALWSLRAMAAPREPFRPGSPHQRGDRKLMELPVADALGAPLNAGTLSALPERLFELLVSHLAGRETLTLAFHAIELANAEDVSPELASQYLSLRTPWRERERTLLRRLERLADGRDRLTCSELVTRLT